MPLSLTRTCRRLAGREGQPPGFWARLGVLVADPATWRDLMWITVDTLVGWLLALTPAACSPGACSA